MIKLYLASSFIKVLRKEKKNIKKNKFLMFDFHIKKYEIKLNTFKIS